MIKIYSLRTGRQEFSALLKPLSKNILTLKLMVMLVMLGASSKAQISGVKDIPGDYPTLAQAIIDLNAQGVGPGGVTLNLLPGNPETALTGGYVIGGAGSLLLTTSSSANPVIINGNGNTITASGSLVAGTLTDAIFKLIGADWITLQGFVMQENAANTTTTAASNNMTEWGVALLYATTTDGAQNNTIQNNTISLNRTYANTFGIYSNSTHAATTPATSATATTLNGSNSGLNIFSNQISNVNNGIVVVGPTAAANFNDGINIGGTNSSTGNTITNFGTTGTFSSYANVSGTVNGILLRNSKSYNISYNNIQSSNGGTSAGTLNGIHIPAFSIAPTGTFLNKINNNVISLISGVSTGAINGINELGTSATSTSSIEINNNDFVSCGHSIASSGTIIFIRNAATHQFQNINNNRFTSLNLNTTGSVTFINNTNSNPSATGIKNVNNNLIINSFNKTGSGGTLMFFTDDGSDANGSISNFNNNNFNNVSVTGSTVVTGISFTNGSGTSSSPNKNINNNIISDLIGGTGAFIGISINWDAATNHINGNIISNINSQGAVTAFSTSTSGGSAGTWNFYQNEINNLTGTGTGTVTAFSIGSATGRVINIYKNKIYNLTNTNVSGLVHGIVISSGSTFNVYNNYIGDLKTPFANLADAIRAINITSSTLSSNVNISFNTIHLNATSSGTNFGTTGIFHTTSTTASTATLNLRNNIISNSSISNGAGLTVAYRRSSSTLTNYGSVSNNNLFNSTGLIFFDGTNSEATLAGYQTRVGPTRDAQSKSENPSFLSTSGSDPLFLHISTSIPTQIESGGIAISGINDDFDGDVRFGSAGYAGTGTAPDIGADEFNGTLACFSMVSITSSAGSEICEGGTGTLLTAICNTNCSNSQSFTWSPALGLSGTSGASVTANPATTTTYFVSMITDAGCTGNASITVTVNGRVIINSVSATPSLVCNGGLTNLSANITNNQPGPSSTIISENFNGSAAGWTMINNTTGGTPANTAWTLRQSPYTSPNSSPVSFSSNDATGFILSNADHGGSGSSVHTLLLSPVFNTTGYISATIQFYHYYRLNSSGEANVEVSLNGTTWTTIKSYTSTQGSATGFVLETINLPAGFVNQPGIQVRFRYQNGWAWYWAIDNFSVIGIQPSPLTYSWSSTPAGFSSTDQNPTNVIVPLTTTYLVIATNAAGCSATESVLVTAGDPLVCNPLNISGNACPGLQTISASALGGGLPYTFSWTKNGQPIAGTTSSIIADEGTHLYEVTITDACGATCTSSATVTVNPTPLVAVNSGTICNPGGSAVTLTATGASTYSWTPAGGLSATTGSTVTANPTSTAVYTVTGTDGNGCTATATSTVTVSSALNITSVTATPTVICSGGTSQLQTNADFINTLTYCVPLQSGGSCITSVLLNTLNSSTPTCTSPFYLQVTPSGLNTTQLNPGISYGLTVTTQNAAIVSVWIDYNRNGIFEASEWVQPYTNASTGTVTITIPANASIGLTRMRVRSRGTGSPNGATDACTQFFSGSTNDYIVTIGNPIINYSWSPSTFLNDPSIANPVASGVTSTTIYTVTATSLVGCSATGTITVTAGQPLSCNALTEAGNACPGQKTITASAIGGGLPYTYSWTKNGLPITGTTSSIIADVGTYLYEVTITDACGATCVSSATVTVNPTPSVAVNSGTICNPGGSAVTLIATGASTYSWTPASGLSATTGSSVTANPASTTIYTVTGTDGNGCTATVTSTVTVAGAVIVNSVTATPSTVCSGGITNLSAGFINNQPGPSSVIITENFNSTPAGWTMINNTTGGTPANTAWTLRQSPYTSPNSSPVTFSSNDASGFMLSNADHGGSGTSVHTVLVSPVFSTVGYTSATLQFYHYYRLWTSGEANVELSLNGVNWTNVKSYTTTQGAVAGFILETIALPSGFINQPNVQVRFRYQNGWAYYWAIDNFSIMGIQPGPLTYSWSSTPAGFSSADPNPSGVVVPATTTFTVTATNAAGCSATGTVLVSTAPLTCNPISVTGLACEGTQVLTANPIGGGPYTYSWTENGQSIGGNTASITANVGTFTYTCTVSNSCGETCVQTLVVTTYPFPVITVNSGSICLPGGSPVTLTASGATTYSWSPANGLSASIGSTVTANPSATTVFTVTGTTDGCSSTATATVNVSNTPPAPTTTGYSVCQYSSIPAGQGLTASCGSQVVPVLSENFDAVPTGWTQQNLSSGGTPAATAWGLYPNGYAPGGFWPSGTVINSNDNSQFAFTNSDAGGSGQTQTLTILQSPSFSTVGYTALNLTYYNFYKWWNSSDTVLVQISTDGINWTTVKSYAQQDAGTANNFVQETINLNAYVGYSNVQIRFRYRAVWGYGWAIDNVVVNGTLPPSIVKWYDAPTGGNLLYTGSVFDPVGNGNLVAPAPGLYTYYARCASQYCESFGTPAVIEIMETPVPVITSSALLPLCMGETTTLSTQYSNLSGYIFNWDAGVYSSSEITVAAPGSYFVVITAPNGCTSSGSSIEIETATIFADIGVVTNTSCFGGSDGSIEIFALGTFIEPSYDFYPGPFNYSINSGTLQSSPVFSGLPSGNYFIEIHDILTSCVHSIYAAVGHAPELIIDTVIINNQILCNGLANGSATVIATGGIGGYTFIWNTPVPKQGSHQANLPPGTWTVTVTDANGCTATASVTITEPSVLQASSASQINVSCNGGDNGSVMINTTGGTSPYTGTGIKSGLAAGTYTYIVTDANSCSATVTVTITQPPVLQATSASQINVNCHGLSNGSVTINATGGTSPYIGTGIKSGLAAGTYAYIVTDANSCSATVTVTITQPPVLQATSASQSNVSCHGLSNGSVIINATGGTTPYTGTGLKSGLTAGTHIFTVIDANGCSASVSVSITQPAVLQTTSASQINVSCNGGTNGSVIINATGGTAPYNGTGLKTGLIAGTHTFTVTDVNGCSASSSVTISEPSALSINASSSDATYFGASNGTASVSVTGGTPGYTYLWSNGATTSNISGLAAGTYTVIVRDINMCTATTNAIINQPAFQCSGSNTHVKYGQGGWGGTPSGNNPATYLYSNFASAFPQGLVVGHPSGTPNGCNRSLRLTTPQAVTAFLPSTGSPAQLPNNHLLNPTASQYGNILASQIVALTINIRFDDFDPNFSPGSTVALGDMLVNISSSPYNNWTIRALLVEGNRLLACGGNKNTLSQISDAIDKVNIQSGAIKCPGSPAAKTIDSGVVSANNNLNLNAYPNPTSGNVTVEFEAPRSINITLSVMDLSGRVMISEFINGEEGKNTHSFDLSAVAKGVYIVRISNDNVIETLRLVVQ